MTSYRMKYKTTCPDRDMDTEICMYYQQERLRKEAEENKGAVPSAISTQQHIDSNAVKIAELATNFGEKLQIALSSKSTASETVLPTIPTGASITKDARHKLFGSKLAGGAESMKPENWQREMIEKYTRIHCPKTHFRINLRTHKMENIKNPNTKAEGFDYSEYFDGCQNIPGQTENKVFINLKCIVGQGGVQTRSLREVYWFIEGQLQTLINQPIQSSQPGQSSQNANNSNIYFANILDGDCCHKFMTQFNYLLNRPEYVAVKNNIFVGDLYTYCNSWFPQKFNPSSPSSISSVGLVVAVDAPISQNTGQ